jgi:uncharacterized protein
MEESMSADEIDRNVQTIQTVYAAFGRGDVPAILARLAPDARFAFAGGAPEVPWHGPWQGAAAITRFFGVLAEAVELQAFEPLAFAASPDAVAVRLHLRYVVRATGKTVDEQQVQWWTIRDGRISELVHFEDTAQVVAASAARV